MQRQDYLYDSEIFKRIFEQYYKLLCYFAEKKGGRSSEKAVN